MSITQTIRNPEQLSEFRNFYLASNERNYALIVIGLNTALRISDVLGLKWGDVYSKHSFKEHVVVREKKTGKENIIRFNRSCTDALDLYRRKTVEAYASLNNRLNILYNEADLDRYLNDRYIFESPRVPGQPLSRQQAFRIIKKAACDIGIEGTISCHSLRKTFGYHAWNKGCPPALLMNIYNHSSYEITKRYLCIDQDERDEIFMKNEL